MLCHELSPEIGHGFLSNKISKQANEPKRVLTTVFIGAGRVLLTLPKSLGTTAQPTRYVLIRNVFSNTVRALIMLPAVNSVLDFKKK